MAKIDATPWERANIVGPVTARATDGKTLGKLLSKAKRPLIVAGSQILYELNEKKLIDYIIEIAKKKNIPIIATAHMVREFKDRGVNAKSMGILEITNLLRDDEWQGLDGNGPYDVVAYVGGLYYQQSLMLQCLKHFGKMRTLTLDKYYHPNATMSFGNMSDEDWEKELKEVIENL
ncbi:MAG: CO dehydrogenase/acetyl-CoA synthase complex subunit epsilon [Candidatus Hydrothermarchaeota archaeon]